MAFEPFNWTCPYCDRAQAVTNPKFSVDEANLLSGESTRGSTRLQATSIVCANRECNRLTLTLNLHERYFVNGSWRCGEQLEQWKLLPESSAKPQPDYISKALRDDYTEACRIANLSPKASATLARRCLQGMIRDFAGIKEKTLFKEIKKLRKAVDDDSAPRSVTHESVEAIDHVRGIGNIGAHMEEDVNLIIEIEPGEAEQLIGLIELLFKEWYVDRHERQRRLAAIKATFEAKVEAKKPKAAAPKSEGQEGVAPKPEGQESAASAEGT